MSGLYIGADVGGTAVKWIAARTDGAVIAQGDVPTDAADPRATLARLMATVRGELGGEAREVPRAVGLACAGIVNPTTGRLGRSPNLPGWENCSLGALLSEMCDGVPSVVDNDVNAALYGEYRYGAGRGCRDLVMIALGTGVGGGVLLGERLHRGAACGAGEIGHMVLDLEGPLCGCGNRGCLEAYAGSVAILRAARERVRDPEASAGFRALLQEEGTELTTRVLHELAEQGDTTARDLFAVAGRRLGQAVANVANLLEPERVIVGGGVARAGAWILVPCREVVQRLVLSEESKRLPVVPAELGPHAAARGAAALAAEREF